MRRFLLVLYLTLISEVALATPQIADRIVFGGRTYVLREIPMLGLWDFEERRGFRVGTGRELPPPFDVRSSANWDGYEAEFEIRDSKLFLRRIVGALEGKERTNAEIMPGKTFPLHVTWFTGRIHLAVGDDDPKTGDMSAVIVFTIEKGNVTSLKFHERLQPPFTWNGLPAPAVDDQDDEATVPLKRE